MLCQSCLHIASETFLHHKKIRIRFDFLRFHIHSKHFDRKGWQIQKTPKKRIWKFRCARTLYLIYLFIFACTVIPHSKTIAQTQVKLCIKVYYLFKCMLSFLCVLLLRDFCQSSGPRQGPQGLKTLSCCQSKCNKQNSHVTVCKSSLFKGLLSLK